VTPGLDRAVLDRLIDLGRQRGGLTPEDLREHLPIAALGAEDLALIVLEIEEAGVPVEIEEMLAALMRPAGLRDPGGLAIGSAAPPPAPVSQPGVQPRPE
ncbi:RNA polymerase sigma factor region1.1 domain-containing protein, partial [Methylobacterium sp. A54F]